MKYVSRFYNFFVFSFLYAPIIVMIVYSFNGIKSRSVFSGFSLQWYKELFNDAVIMKSLYISLVIAVLAAVISTVIGTMAAVGINSMKGFKKKVIDPLMDAAHTVKVEAEKRIIQAGLQAYGVDPMTAKACAEAVGAVENSRKKAKEDQKKKNEQYQKEFEQYGTFTHNINPLIDKL